MSDYLEYYNSNLLIHYPFADTNVDNATLPIQNNWFADLIFYSFDSTVNSVYLSNLNINPIGNTATFTFSSYPGNSTVLVATLVLANIVDNTIASNTAFLSFSSSTAAVKFVFGPGFLPLLSTTINQNYAHTEAALSSSAVILNIPKVLTLNFLNHYPSSTVKTYTASNPHIFAQYDANIVANDISNNMVLDVEANTGTGLFNPCTNIFPTEDILTINSLVPDVRGNIFLIPSPCYSISVLNSSDLVTYGAQLSNYETFSIPYQSPNTFDALIVGKSFFIINNCSPKCPPENFNAFANYLNRLYNGIQELFYYADSPNQTTGNGNTVLGNNIFTASVFNSTYPGHPGFIKYFHEGKSISFQVNSNAAPTTYTIAAVIDSNNVQLTSNFSSSITNAIFSVDDLGVFQKINNAIIFYNTNVSPLINEPNGQVLFTTSEGNDEFGNFGTFVSIVCVIENPTDFTETFSVAETLIGSITVVPGTQKVRYNGTVTFNTSVGTLTCKTFATYEIIYFIPCGNLTASVNVQITSTWQSTTGPLPGGQKLISVTSSSCPPVVTSSDTVTLVAGHTFCYALSATNGANEVIFEPSTLPSWATTTSAIPSTCNISGTSTDVTNTIYTVNMTVVNASGAYTPFTLYINVISTPVITVTNQNTNYGDPFIYQISATGFPTSYTAIGLPTNLVLNTATGIISGTTNEIGTYGITVSATNAAGTGYGTFNIDVTRAIPVITSPTTASGVEGLPFSYQIIALNSPTSYSSSPLPVGLSFNSITGLIYGASVGFGTFNIVIGATNSVGTAQQNVALTFTQAAPVITSPTLFICGTGVSTEYDIIATNTPTSYGATGLPSALTVNTGTGKITGTVSAVGVTTATVSATNAAGTGSQNVVFDVISGGGSGTLAPVITSSLSHPGTLGVSYSYTITASNTPTSYNASNLPPGLTVNTSSGVISGTPTQLGSYSSTISASNIGGTGYAVLFILISQIPVITSSLTVSGSQGAAFSYQITATQYPTSYNATGLPSALTVNTSTGLISGTPSGSGTTSVPISATNNSGTDNETLVISISGPIPAVTGATYQSQLNSAFSYNVIATNSPTSYALVSGNLPTGLTLHTSTGLIDGTPTIDNAFSCVISATNANGTGHASFVFQIVTTPTIFTGNQTAPVGSPFSFNIVSSDYPTSYGATGLPSALSINTSTGVISGTIASGGVTSVNLSATNIVGTGHKTITITAS